MFAQAQHSSMYRILCGTERIGHALLQGYSHQVKKHNPVRVFLHQKLFMVLPTHHPQTHPHHKLEGLETGIATADHLYS